MENIQSKQNAGAVKISPSGHPKGNGKNAFVRFFKKNGAGFVFALPVTLGLLFFTAYPLLASLYYSFFKTYTVIRPPEGFSLTFNFAKMFSDQEWIKAIANTGIYTLISVPMFMVLSFALALALNSRIKGIGIYRMLIYMPCVMSAVVSGIAWRSLIDVDYGWFNRVLRLLNLEPYPFLSEAATSMPTLIIVGLWSLGGPMVLWLSQLKNISADLYKAADLDGANSFLKLITITIPMCSPMIFYNLIMNIIATLQTFAAVTTLTGGTAGVENSLLFYVTKIYSSYETCITTGSMGYTCAMAWFLFVVIAILTGVIFKTSKWVFYGGD